MTKELLSSGSQKLIPIRRASPPFGGWPELLVIILGWSLLISLYSFLVGHRFVPNANLEPIEEAAMELSEQLKYVAVTEKRIGKVGLCEISVPGAEGQSKLTRIHGLSARLATLRLSSVLAARLGLDFLHSLAKNELVELLPLQEDLAIALHQAIEPNVYIDGSQSKMLSLYADAHRRISAGISDPRTNLVDLKIKLGRLRGDKYNSGIPCPRLPEEDLADYAVEGKYRANVSIPFAGLDPLCFYALADQTIIVSPALFEEVAPNVVASAILVEASYESTDKQGMKKILTKRRTCALVGAPRMRPRSLALLVSFPHGRVQNFDCLRHLFEPSRFSGIGEWQQSSDGAVPGPGHLAPPLDFPSAEMSSLSAVQLCFYHFLTALGPELNPQALESALAQSWSTEKAEAPPSSPQPNSALVRDTGAGLFALLYQSRPGGVGQQILANAFNGTSNRRFLPESALPLYVTEKGDIRLGGNETVEPNLIKDFFESLRQTSLAAQETESVGIEMEQRLEKAILAAELKVKLLKEELLSLERRVSNGQAATDLVRSNILASEEVLRKYKSLLDTASRVKDNASTALKQTGELSKNLNRYCQTGLCRITGPGSGFLLSGRFWFAPHVEPLKESDIYQYAGIGKNLEDDGGRLSWLSQSKLSLLRKAPSEGPIGEGVIAPKVAQPKFLLFDSKQLLSAEKLKPYILSSSPYTGTALSAGQLIYCAPGAFVCGSEPSSKWTLLIRDLLAFAPQGQNSTIKSASESWWQKESPSADLSPELAAEIQVRSPLPKITGLGSGYAVRGGEEGSASIQIYPAMPPAMF